MGVLGLLPIATLGYLWLQGRRAALYLVLAIAGGLLVSLALKAVLQRPRPGLISPGLTGPHSERPFHALGHRRSVRGSMLARVHRRRSVRLYVLGCALLATLLVGLSRI